MVLIQRVRLVGFHLRLWRAPCRGRRCLGVYRCRGLEGADDIAEFFCE